MVIFRIGILVNDKDKVWLGWVKEKIVIKEVKIVSIDNFFGGFFIKMIREMGKCCGVLWDLRVEVDWWGCRRGYLYWILGDV